MALDLFGPSRPYIEDIDLMERLGLDTQVTFPREWKDLGTVVLDAEAQNFSQSEEHPRPDAKIKVEVCAFPAQFWRFTIDRPNEDNYKQGFLPMERFVVETGSGSMTEYWPIVEKIVGQMVTITHIPEENRCPAS